jgi:hypothetical protein
MPKPCVAEAWLASSEPPCYKLRPSGMEPTSLPRYVRPTADGVRLALKVQPRAAHNEIAGPLGDELRIRLTAPPVDSAANQALVEFLAERLGCPRRQVRLERGAASRHKIVRIQGLEAALVARRLEPG